MNALFDQGRSGGLRARIRAEFPPLEQPLQSEDDITREWQKGERPVVTVLCATFNHVEFIADALRGFLIQRTTFPFEVVVRDDASTDGTQSVIEEFAQRYPRIIRAVLNPRNRLQQGVRPVHDYPNLITGEFSALCQGDDFWVDPDKLQRQVDHLRCNPSVVLTAGATLCVRASDGSTTVTGEVGAEVIYPNLPHSYHHTSTYLVRSQAYREIIARHLIPTGLYGDTPLRHLIRLQGRISALPGTFSVYWIHDGGVWSSLDDRRKSESHIEMYARLARAMPIRHKPEMIRELVRHAARLAFLRSSGTSPRFDHVPFWRRQPVRRRWRLLRSALAISVVALRTPRPPQQPSATEAAPR